MAGDRDVKQERRRSFFLFGSVNLGRSDPTVKPSDTKQRKPSVSKLDTSKGPLDKQPLNSNNPFVKTSVSGSDRVTSEGTSSYVNEHPAKVGPDSPKRANTNPFLNVSTSSQNTNPRMRVRKPPPPIDMNSIRVFTQTAHRGSTLGTNVSQPSSTEETLKSASHSPMNTPVPGKLTSHQHRRQRSEAEKLVDDLDEYIKQHEDNGSIQPQSDQEEAWLKVDTSRASSEHSSDVPSASVEPLDISLENKNKTDANSHHGRSDYDSEQEDDRFSFTDSLNGKSVNSIQQVAMSEVTGAAPIAMSLHYENLSSGSSANGRPRESLVDAPGEDGNKSASSEDEFQDVEQGPSSELSFDATSSRSEDETPKRVFRVVNEDRPHFYFQTGDSTTYSASDSTTTEEDEQQRRYDKGIFNSQSPMEEPTSGFELNDLITTVSPPLSYSSSRRDDSNDTELPRSLDNDVEPGNSATRNELDNIGLLLDAGALTVKPEEVIEDTNSLADGTIDKVAVPSNQSLKSGSSYCTNSSGSTKPDKTVRLVSSYVEELRLKYYKSSNFLAAPPNLPISLKQKNNLIQPKNIKVRIRTSSKQIGIKHGGAKQKLLSLETANEDSRESFSSANFSNGKNRINVDHTKEFHDLLAKEGQAKSLTETNEPAIRKKDDDYYLEDIPGDDAYDSDDAMAPLRKGNGSLDRNNTVVSYYTKNQRRFRSGTLDNGYAYLQDLPTNINIADYENEESLDVNDPVASIISEGEGSITPALSYGKAQTLHVANPDTDSD